MGQEVEGLLRRRSDFGCVDQQTLAGVRGERDGLVVEVEVADKRVVDAFCPVGVEPDIVGGPSGPELVAAGCEFPDEVGEVPVERIPASFCT